ncbi:MAG: HAD hydrolase-like protein [Deltaproteobacteria bacterium]|nr:HAD hydrolase-like protein [Deltaproteobacteria bacterium]
MFGKRHGLVWTVAAICLFAFATPPVSAGTPCIEAVFFDLGNTLVEDPGNGIFVLRTGAAQTVADLQALGVALGVITNVPGGWTIEDLEALLAEPEFLDEFDTVILSSQAPAPKPDPAIYTFAHASLPAPQPAITSSAFVGETLSEIANSEDNPTTGARSVGMVGIHLSDAAPSPLADFTIPTDDLGQVVTIVRASCPVFEDDFESGDTTEWPLTVPN